MRRQTKQGMSIGILIAVVVLPIAAFFGGIVVSTVASVWHAAEYKEQIATKPYVDKGLEDTRRFAIDQDKLVMKDAHEYSDTNRRDTWLHFEQMMGEVRSELKSYGAKQDMILENQRSMQDAYNQRKR